MRTDPVDANWLFPELPVDIDPSDTALLVIDMQLHDAHREFGYAGAMAERAHGGRGYYFERIESTVIPNLSRLLDAFRDMSARVVHVTVGAELDDLSDLSQPAIYRSNQRLSMVGRPSWYPRSDRVHKILPELQPVPGELVLNKTTIGTFTSTNLERILHNMGVSTLVIAGVNTTVCVETTARVGVDLGFHVALVEDACAGVDPESHAATMRAFRRHFGRVADTATIINEIQRSSLGASPPHEIPRQGRDVQSKSEDSESAAM